LVELVEPESCQREREQLLPSLALAT